MRDQVNSFCVKCVTHYWVVSWGDYGTGQVKVRHKCGAVVIVNCYVDIVGTDGNG